MLCVSDKATSPPTNHQNNDYFYAASKRKELEKFDKNLPNFLRGPCVFLGFF
jgi:hypothetical protein